MPKEEQTSLSQNGASPNGVVSAEERAFLDRAQARYRKLHEQLVAEGVDSSREYAELLVAADTWPE